MEAAGPVTSNSTTSPLGSQIYHPARNHDFHFSLHQSRVQRKVEWTKAGPLGNPTGEGQEKQRRRTGKGKDGQGGKKGTDQARTPEEPHRWGKGEREEECWQRKGWSRREKMSGPRKDPWGTHRWGEKRKMIQGEETERIHNQNLGGDTFEERGGGDNIFKPDKIKLQCLWGRVLKAISHNAIAWEPKVKRGKISSSSSLLPWWQSYQAIKLKSNIALIVWRRLHPIFVSLSFFLPLSSAYLPPPPPLTGLISKPSLASPFPLSGTDLPWNEDTEWKDGKQKVKWYRRRSEERERRGQTQNLNHFHGTLTTFEEEDVEMTSSKM